MSQNVTHTRHMVLSRTLVSQRPESGLLSNISFSSRERKLFLDAQGASPTCLPETWVGFLKKLGTRMYNFRRHIVFVTGNANKLKEVRAILSDGSNGFAPIEVEARDVDGARDVYSCGLILN